MTKTIARERVGVNLNVWLPADLMEVFEATRHQDLRSKKDQVTVIFQEYFARRGLLKRPDRQGGTAGIEPATPSV